MLKQETREKLQALVQRPEFGAISVHIVDQKMFHSTDNGKPTFYTDVKIHTEGECALLHLISLMPEIELTLREPRRTEREDHVSIGEYAEGRLEGCEVNFWSTFCEISIKKASAPTEATAENREEISHLDCTIDLSKVEPLVDRVWAEEVLKNEGDGVNA